MVSTASNLLKPTAIQSTATEFETTEDGAGRLNKFQKSRVAFIQCNTLVFLNLISGMNGLGKKKITQDCLHQKMLTAMAILDQESMATITVADLAKKVELSEFHFARCFRKVFGESPYQYYLKRKIARSAEMLSSSTMDVSKISLELGFSEVSSFSKSFKRMFGVSPLFFRKMRVHS